MSKLKLNRKRIGRQRKLNCWLLISYLLLTRRLKGFILIWDRIIPHLMGITKEGNYIHFKRTRGTPKLFSLWFEGRVEVIATDYSLLCNSKIKRTKIEW